MLLTSAGQSVRHTQLLALGNIPAGFPAVVVVVDVSFEVEAQRKNVCGRYLVVVDAKGLPDSQAARLMVG